MLALGGQLSNIAEVPATFVDIWPPGYTSVFQSGALFNLSFMELCEFGTQTLPFKLESSFSLAACGRKPSSPPPVFVWARGCPRISRRAREPRRVPR